MSKTAAPIIEIADSIINMRHVKRLYYEKENSCVVILYADGVTDKIPITFQEYKDAISGLKYALI